MVPVSCWRCCNDEATTVRCCRHSRRPLTRFVRIRSLTDRRPHSHTPLSDQLMPIQSAPQLAPPLTAYYSAPTPQSPLPNNRFPPGGNRRPRWPSNTVCRAPRPGTRKDSPSVGPSVRPSVRSFVSRPHCRLIACRRKVVTLRSVAVLNTTVPEFAQSGTSSASRSVSQMLMLLMRLPLGYDTLYHRATMKVVVFTRA